MRRDPERDIDRAMTDCFKCQRMTPTLTLPAHAWPNGKAPKK